MSDPSPLKPSRRNLLQLLGLTGGAALMAPLTRAWRQETATTAPLPSQISLGTLPQATPLAAANLNPHRVALIKTNDRAAGVRQAIAHAIDRQALTKDLYGFMGRPTHEVLVAPTVNTASDNPYPYDLATANRLLDEAGWVDSDGNGIRDLDGIEMEVVFQTSVNPVRQKTQEQIRASLRDIGIAVDIKRVRVDDFFSADPLQTNSINHFYADMQEYAIGNDIPDPIIYMGWNIEIGRAHD